MPTVDDRGFGSTTIDKQTGLEAILHQQFSIITAIIKKWDYPVCYRHIDCCSGIGVNPEIKEYIDGSPLVFLKAIEEYDIPYTAHFIEKKYENFIKLHRLLVYTEKQLKNGRINVINGSYEEELFNIVNSFSSYAQRRYRKERKQYGLIYLDPNSYPNWGIVKQISNHSATKYIDILIHCSATSLKRKNGAFPNLCTLLDDCVTSINKSDWFIRDVLPGDANQMTFLFGTNYEGYEAMNSKRFYDIHSRMGQRIIEKLSLSKEEYLNLPISKGSLEGWGVK